MYKRKQTFEHLLALEAITGHRYAHEIDEANLAPIARAWVLERAQVIDDGDLFRLLPSVFSGCKSSAMSRVMDCTPFQRACNDVLRRACDHEPGTITRRLAQGVEPVIPPYRPHLQSLEGVSGGAA